MKTKEFNKLAREQLCPLLPSFEVGKGLLFEAPGPRAAPRLHVPGLVL